MAHAAHGTTAVLLWVPWQLRRRDGSSTRSSHQASTLLSHLDRLAGSCAGRYCSRGICTSVANGHARADETALDGGAYGLGCRKEAVPVTLQQEQPLQRIRRHSANSAAGNHLACAALMGTVVDSCSEAGGHHAQLCASRFVYAPSPLQNQPSPRPGRPSAQLVSHTTPPCHAPASSAPCPAGCMGRGALKCSLHTLVCGSFCNLIMA